jgi:hypothetical protein
MMGHQEGHKNANGELKQNPAHWFFGGKPKGKLWLSAYAQEQGLKPPGYKQDSTPSSSGGKETWSELTQELSGKAWGGAGKQGSYI